MRPYGHAVLGGTFDHLHVGHLALLDTAFRFGRRVSIGLTTERFLARYPKPLGERLQPFAVRRAVLHRWLRRRYPGRAWRTTPLDDRFGHSVEGGVDVLIVSADTREGGAAVNAERRRRGHRELPVVVVPVVLADDLGPVSSRRIRSGAIDANGHRRAPLRVTIRAEDPRVVAFVRGAVRRAFSRARVTVVPPSTSGSRAAELEVVVERRPAGGWQLTERAGGIEIRGALIPRGPASVLRGATLQLLRPDLGRKAYPPARSSRR